MILAVEPVAEGSSKWRTSALDPLLLGAYGVNDCTDSLGHQLRLLYVDMVARLRLGDVQGIELHRKPNMRFKELNLACLNYVLGELVRSEEHGRHLRCRRQAEDRVDPVCIPWNRRAAYDPERTWIRWRV